MGGTQFFEIFMQHRAKIIEAVFFALHMREPDLFDDQKMVQADMDRFKGRLAFLGDFLQGISRTTL